MTKQANLTFVVMTDTHIQASLEAKYTKHWDQALQDIQESFPDSHGIMHVGDITDNGEQAEFETMVQIWNGHKKDLPPIYFTFGNHDVRWRDFDQQMPIITAATGMHHTYYDVWLEGYHFIFLGTELGLKDCAYLSAEQLTWLDNKLSEQEASEKPAFIFVHEPMKDTVAGSQAEFGWYGIRQDAELKSILAKHPQSIVFTGHTHWELGARSTMNNTKYATMFNAASVAYLWTDEDVEKEGSQGFIVQVYEDRVLVQGRDFAQKSWVAEAQYTVNLPVEIPVIEAPEAEDPELSLGHPVMYINKSVYQPGEPIEVTYRGSLREDAFGIFVRGAKPSEADPILPITYLKTKMIGQPNGKMIFSNLMLTVGSYDMIYLGETLNTELCRMPFDVTLSVSIR